MLNQGSSIFVGKLEFQIHPDGSVYVELDTDEGAFNEWIPLDTLEQFVNAARAHLGQPVLADEVLKLKEYLEPIGPPSEALNQIGYSRLKLIAMLGRIGIALRAMGKLE